MPRSEFTEWISHKPCAVPGCLGAVYHDDGTYRVAPAHLKARGMGRKKYTEAMDKNNVIPLCYKHHTQQGTMSLQEFMDLHQISVWEIAREYWLEFRKEKALDV